MWALLTEDGHISTPNYILAINNKQSYCIFKLKIDILVRDSGFQFFQHKETKLLKIIIKYSVRMKTVYQLKLIKMRCFRLLFTI